MDFGFCDKFWILHKKKKTVHAEPGRRILLTLTGNPTCYQLQRPFVQHTHCSQVSDGGAAAIFMSEEAMSFCCRSVRWDTEVRKAPVNARA